MNLHNDKNVFSQLVMLTAKHFHMLPTYVEKDYWITFILNRLSHSVNSDHVVFKGGTSLSKGFRMINRFSEDIDLAMIHENLSGNALKNKIRSVEKNITIDLIELVEPDITSKGSMFRKSVFTYPAVVIDALGSKIPKRIIVEINAFANPYPYVQQTISSFIAEFLLQIHREDAIERYEMQPFSLQVLDKRRTMVEKLVSLIRFSFAEDYIKSIAAKIRHFYDLYCLTNDPVCSDYLQSSDFHRDIMDLLAHDQLSFDTPENWQNKTVLDSPLVADFPTIWESLYPTYQKELTTLVFSDLPDAKDVANAFSDLISRIK